MKKHQIVIALFIIISFIILLPVHDATDHESGYTSYELTLKEDTNKTEYRRKGKLTYAIDKHYAAIYRKRDRLGRVIRETYVDEKKQPIRQPAGFYALSYRYQGRIVYITYLDAKGKPVRNTSGYTIIRRTLNSQGQAIYDDYLDSTYRQVKCTGGYYGVKRIYNKKGYVIGYQYLNKKHQVMKNTSGYAKVLYTIDDRGVVFSERYYDTKNKPISLTSKQYGVKYKRDRYNRVIWVIYLGKDGKEKVREGGFSSEKHTYWRDGTLKTIMYYKHGKPTRLSQGQYGIRIDGQTSILLNRDGHTLLTPNNLLTAWPCSVVVLGMLVCVLMILVPKKADVIVLLFYIGFMMYKTIMFREVGDNRLNLVLFSCYRTTNRSMWIGGIENIWLFLPFGAGLSRLFKKRALRKACLIGLITTLMIETTQYITGLGTAEFDDVFNNTLGTVIGALIIADLSVIKQSFTQSQDDPADI